MEAEQERCETCRFWLRDGREHGFCLRYPPVVYGPGHQERPMTSSQVWCGEYERAAKAVK